MREKILSLDALAVRCRGLQRQRRKVVLTNGCFDLLHIGHVRYLRKARELGDTLAVALNDDASVRALKGAGRPVVPAAQRAEVLAALSSVDYVTIFSEATAEQVVETLRPDIYVKGGDYPEAERAMPEARIVAGYGGIVVFLDFEAGSSTSAMIDAIVRCAQAGTAQAAASGGGRSWR